MLVYGHLKHERLGCHKCGSGHVIFNGNSNREFRLPSTGSKKAVLIVQVHQNRCKNCDSAWRPQVPFAAHASRLIRNLSKPTPQKKETASVAEYAAIDLYSVSHEETRTVGNEHLLLQIAKQLKIPEKLKELNFSDKQAKIALASIISRAALPASERAAHLELKKQSGLGELLEIDFDLIPLNRFYETSDLLLKNKKECILKNNKKSFTDLQIQSSFTTSQIRILKEKLQKIPREHSAHLRKSGRIVP